METEIGPTLREARIRRKIDLADVEARTKIRVRYLRALENEEWDLLPGDTYARSFIRTYANFLSLDGDRLADDYRQLRDDAVVEGYSRAEAVGLAPRSGLGRGGLPRIGTGAAAGLISIALIGLLVAIFALSGGSEGGGGAPSASNAGTGKGAKNAQQGRSQQQQAAARHASLELTASAEVWVCVLDASGSRLVNGQILGAGATEGPFRSGRFDISFGNGAISMRVNGKDVQVPESASPLGYEIVKGKVHPLSESERPTCE